VKDLIDKFGLNEVLAYLCPGVFLLGSLALWLRPDFAPLVGDKLATNAVVVGTLLLVAAYAVGLMGAAWSGQGARAYLRRAARKACKASVPKAKFSLRALLWPLLWSFHWIPSPCVNRSVVDGQLRIAEGLATFGGLQGLTRLENPWDRLAIFRTIVCGRVASRGLPILAEAEAVHRRLLFALNMALVFLLIALQALVRLVFYTLSWVHLLGLPDVPIGVLWVLVVLGIAASFGLRYVAARWWEQELLLTCSLTR